MVKTLHSFLSCSVALLWVHLLAVVLADNYDNQLLNVNASWPSGAKLFEQDCCDGNISNTDSLSPFREGPPIVYLKTNHDDVYPESYIQATNKSLLSSKYLVIVTLYNETKTPDMDYNTVDYLWIQGNMTASTPGDIITDNNTFVTLHNETEPLLPYRTDFNLTDLVSNLRFDQTTWQLSVGVYQQTAEFEDFLYAEFVDGDDPKYNKTSLFYRIAYIFGNTEYGTENPSTLYNSTSISPWGRVYTYTPGIFDSTSTATPTTSSSSITGGSGPGPSTSSSTSQAVKSGAVRQTMCRGACKGAVFVFIWMISAISANLF